MADNVRRSHGRRRILDEARRQGVATILISCRCNPSLVCYCKPPHPNEETPPGLQPTRLDHASSGAVGRRQPPRSRSRRAAAAAAAARDPFGNLPPELLPTILSNLDVKESARTSVLSSAWRHAWKLSPKLTLDIAAICGDGYLSCKHGEEQYRAFLDRARYVQRFIDTVDTILAQRRRSVNVVEQLELRFDDHHLPRVSSRLDDWIRFAVSSAAKSVALHVSDTPLGAYGRDQQYELPLQLLDAGGGVSSLHHIHLSHVSVKLPSNTHSIGFPSLKSLGLHTATVSTSDLQHILSNCPNLERLGLYMVYPGVELRVLRPLPRLLYLRLIDCFRVTKIELNADKLTTFTFRGHSVPTVNLGETSGVRNVNIHCHDLTLQQAVTSLPNAFPMVQRLCLSCACIVPTFPLLRENTYMFSHLRYLQLRFRVYNAGALSIAYLLEFAPLLEELDIKFVSSDKNVGEGPPRGSAQGQSEYKRLKCLTAREFAGHKDQLALMLHIVESAPALEILTIDPIKQHASASFDPLTKAAETTSLSDIRRRATTLIGEKLSTKTKFIVG